MEDENQWDDTEKSGKWWLRKVALVKDLRSNVNANVQQGKRALMRLEVHRHFEGTCGCLYKAGDSILIKPKSLWLLRGHPTA